jgi:hypothetical protein
MAGINFRAFDLGGHEIARKVWKDYYAKVCCPVCPVSLNTAHHKLRQLVVNVGRVELLIARLGAVGMA